MLVCKCPDKNHSHSYKSILPKVFLVEIPSLSYCLQSSQSLYYGCSFSLFACIATQNTFYTDLWVKSSLHKTKINRHTKRLANIIDDYQYRVRQDQRKSKSETSLCSRKRIIRACPNGPVTISGPQMTWPRPFCAVIPTTDYRPSGISGDTQWQVRNDDLYRIGIDCFLCFCGYWCGKMSQQCFSNVWNYLVWLEWNLRDWNWSFSWLWNYGMVGYYVSGG